jgi:hypothetical protein
VIYLGETDLDKIVDGNEVEAVVIEAERVNQAVADGKMEMTDADQWLADLETRVEANFTTQHASWRIPCATTWKGQSTTPSA